MTRFQLGGEAVFSPGTLGDVFRRTPLTSVACNVYGLGPHATDELARMEMCVYSDSDCLSPLCCHALNQIKILSILGWRLHVIQQENVLSVSNALPPPLHHSGD